MINYLRPIASFLGRFGRSEGGNASIEFVMMMPLAIMITFTTYETGILSTRQVMLERGLDVVVRRVRIGAIPDPKHDDLKAAICEEALVIPDCLNQVKLEMVIRDPRNWQNMSAQPDCIDRVQVGTPLINFTTGGNNQLMVLRVCALYDPVMPNTIIGSAIPKESEGAYALTAVSSFVMEPFQ
ncbi:TadE/TadG family type IV pilus assembly protein [Yoonia sp. 208BN28-4]|uniref:TadE/TadG family type IV pilus assembly protein n=1 Tax=Yoonia sp. 208BN28-4 TaxID=3126505 RepID=UPI0030B5A2DA